MAQNKINLKHVSAVKKVFTPPIHDDLVSFYGTIEQASKMQVKINPPYEMKLEWDKETILKSIVVHKRIADYVEQAFKDIANTYDKNSRELLGLNLFSGSFNVRKKRGAEDEPDSNLDGFSLHSWGIAIDIFAIANKLRFGWKRSAFSNLEYLEFILIMYKYGAVNLGLEANFDAMHFQWLQLSI